MGLLLKAYWAITDFVYDHLPHAQILQRQLDEAQTIIYCAAGHWKLWRTTGIADGEAETDLPSQLAAEAFNRLAQTFALWLMQTFALWLFDASLGRWV